MSGLFTAPSPVLWLNLLSGAGNRNSGMWFGTNGSTGYVPFSAFGNDAAPADMLMFPFAGGGFGLGNSESLLLGALFMLLNRDDDEYPQAAPRFRVDAAEAEQSSSPSGGEVGYSSSASWTVTEEAPEPVREVYVLGNFSYPISTEASANGRVDYSKTLKSEFEEFFPGLKATGIFDRLDPAAQQVSDTYGDKFRKTVVIDKDGKLVGVYETADFVAANPQYNITNGENSIPIGSLVTLPDGQEAKVLYDVYDSPLTVDLDGSGKLTAPDRLHYDISGDGIPEVINDIAAGAGVFCLDDGSDGTELFGNNTDLSQFGGKSRYSDGFEALRDLAEIAAQRGYLDPEDQRNLERHNKLDDSALEVLEEKFGLKIKIGSLNSAAQSLQSAGITEINLGDPGTDKFTENFDGLGNAVETKDGATAVVNGQIRSYADVWFNTVSAAA